MLHPAVFPRGAAAKKDGRPTKIVTTEVRVCVQTLRAVTEGKIHVELERARLTRQLAKIRESEGKVAEAADLMSEVQVWGSVCLRF